MSVASMRAAAALQAAHDVAAERVPALTGVRALAAGWVLLFHAWIVAGSPRVALPGTGIALSGVFSTGWLGVDLFFVLSGFVLTWQATQPRVAAARFDLGGFLARRVLRVYPAYYGCLTVLLALAWLRLREAPPDPIDLALHLTMMHNAAHDTVGTINGVFWSLPFEWQFYLIFPAMLWCARRGGPVAMVVVALAAAAAWRWFALLRAPTPAVFVGPVVLDALAQLPFRIDQFAIGMGAAFVARRVAFASPAANACAWIGAAALATHAAWCAVFDIVWWQPDATPFVRLPWMALATGVTLIGLARSTGLVARIFAARPMVWLGEVSYSIYLWHLAVLMAIGIHGAAPGTTAALAAVTALGVPATLAISAASYYGIERPFLQTSIWGATRARKIGFLALWGATLFAIGTLAHR
jgi:peptidoglycan/LPS O-acetylase OafA/YrhL